MIYSYNTIKFPFIVPESGKIYSNFTAIAGHLTRDLKINHKDYYDKHNLGEKLNCFFCGKEGKFVSFTKGYINKCTDIICINKSSNGCSINCIMFSKNCSEEEAKIIQKTYTIPQRKKAQDTINKRI